MRIHLSKKWIMLPIMLVVVASLVLAGCSSNSSTTTTTSAPAVTTTSTSSTTTTVPPVTTTTSTTPTVAQATTLNGAGATFPAPIYTKWFDEYFKITNVKINYQAVGSGAGIQQITAGTVDFGASDGIMSADQITAAEAVGGPILHIPMVSGSEAIIYNISGITSGQLKLTGEVLANIYLKKILLWSDPAITALNPGLSLPDQPIAVVHRSDGSGTTFIFTNYLSKVSMEWLSKVGNATSVSWPGDIGGNGNAGVAGQVQQLPNSIGYVELAYALQNNLPYAQMKNAAGNYELPTIAGTIQAAAGVPLPADMKIMLTNSANADAYPICGFTWILAFKNQADQARGLALANYLWWAIHDGQAFTGALNYASLSPDAVKNAENEVRSINYKGQVFITK